AGADRHRLRGHHRGAEALDGAGEDEGADRAGERTPQGGEGEHHQPGAADRARAELVPEPPGDEKRDRVGKQVRGVHPQHLRVISAEPAHHRGHRDGHDRRVHEDHEESDDHRPQRRPRGARGHWGRGHAGSTSSIWQITPPAETVWPACALSPWTRPERWATRGCSIFIASRTTTRSPSATTSPSSTATLTIVPCIGIASAFPPPAPAVARFPERRGRRCFGLLFPPSPRPAGSTTSRRLPPTSTTTRSIDSSSSSTGAGTGAGASSGRVNSARNSDSIHVV